MNTRALQHFVKVVEHGSFSKAAIVLGMNQPALSRSIRDLEAELGVSLLYRDGRGVQLTAEGERVLKSASSILDVVSELQRDLVGMEKDRFRGIVVGMLPSATRLLTLPLTVSLRRSYPEAKLHIVEGSSGHLLEWLADGRLDIAVLNDSAAVKRFKLEPVLSQSLHLIGSIEAASLPPAVPFSRLTDYPLILSSRTHGTRREIETLAQERGIKLNVVIEADSLSALLQLLASGYGWSVTPGFMIDDGGFIGRLQGAPIVEPEISRDIVLATPLNRPTAPGISDLLRTFRNEIRRVYARHVTTTV